MKYANLVKTLTDMLSNPTNWKVNATGSVTKLDVVKFGPAIDGLSVNDQLTKYYLGYLLVPSKPAVILKLFTDKYTYLVAGTDKSVNPMVLGEFEQHLLSFQSEMNRQKEVLNTNAEGLARRKLKLEDKIKKDQAKVRKLERELHDVINLGAQ